jgi:hypothetical protein
LINIQAVGVVAELLAGGEPQLFDGSIAADDAVERSKVWFTRVFKTR